MKSYSENFKSKIGQKLRIAHIVDYLMPKMGYQEFLLPKWNARHGHEVHIFTSDRYAPVADYELTWGKFLGPRVCGAGLEIIEDCQIHRLPCQLELRYRPVLAGLIPSLKNYRPQVIFCHGSASLTSLQAAFTGWRLGIPVLMDNHMTFGCQDHGFIGRTGYAFLRLISRQFLNRFVYLFLGVAKECSDFLHQQQGITLNKIRDLPLGLDTELFSPDPEGGRQWRKQNNIPEQANVVLQTGKLTEDKSPHWLSQAMAPLLKSNSALRLVFIGSGSEKYLKKIRSYLVAEGVLGQTLFLPLVPVTELAAIYSQADICVYPDATSLSCLEAAACETAVIISDLPASKWRESKGIGLSYSTGNIVELRSKVSALLTDQQKRLTMAKNSQQAVLKHFSYNAIATLSEKMMLEAIEAKTNSGT